MSEFGHATSHGGRQVTLDQIRKLPDLQPSNFSLEITLNPLRKMTQQDIDEFAIQTASFSLNKIKQTFSIYQVINIGQDILDYPDRMFAGYPTSMKLQLFNKDGRVKTTIHLLLRYTGAELIMNFDSVPAVHYITFDVLQLTVT